MLVEQTRGIKLDVLKILRSPITAMKMEESIDPIFAVNETVLRIKKSGGEKD